MRILQVLTMLLGIAASAEAQGMARFQGVWGDPRQCRGLPIISGGSRLASPFEIGSQWMKTAEIWCALTWISIEVRPEGAFAALRARCGEDAVRSYGLGLALHDTPDAEETLTILWDDSLANGPLHRCRPSSR